MNKKLEQTAKEIASLTEQAIKDEKHYEDLIDFINLIIKDKSLNLRDVYNLASEHFEDVNSFFFLQNLTQNMATTTELQDNEGNYYNSSLFLVPIIFVEDKTNTNSEINVESDEFSQFINSFKESQFFQDDDSFFLHNHLYHPKELIDAQYEDIIKMSQSMTNFLICPEDDLIDVNPVPHKASYQENTLTIRYLLGVRIYDSNKQLDQATIESTAKNFINIAKPNIEKILNLENVLLLAPNLFYDSLKEGLELFSATSIHNEFNNALTEHCIHPHGVEALIYLSENEDDLNITLKSKLTDENIALHKISIFDFTQPDDLILECFYALQSLNIKTENIFLTIDNHNVPIKKYLNQVQEEMIEDFDNQVVEYQETKSRKFLH